MGTEERQVPQGVSSRCTHTWPWVVMPTIAHTGEQERGAQIPQQQMEERIEGLAGKQSTALCTSLQLGRDPQQILWKTGQD